MEEGLIIKLSDFYNSLFVNALKKIYSPTPDSVALFSSIDENSLELAINTVTSNLDFAETTLTLTFTNEEAAEAFSSFITIVLENATKFNFFNRFNILLNGHLLAIFKLPRIDKSLASEIQALQNSCLSLKDKLSSIKNSSNTHVSTVSIFKETAKRKKPEQETYFCFVDISNETAFTVETWKAFFLKEKHRNPITVLTDSALLMHKQDYSFIMSMLHPEKSLAEKYSILHNNITAANNLANQALIVKDPINGNIKLLFNEDDLLKLNESFKNDDIAPGSDFETYYKIKCLDSSHWQLMKTILETINKFVFKKDNATEMFIYDLPFSDNRIYQNLYTNLQNLYFAHSPFFYFILQHHHFTSETVSTSEKSIMTRVKISAFMLEQFEKMQLIVPLVNIVAENLVQNSNSSLSSNP